MWAETRQKPWDSQSTHMPRQYLSYGHAKVIGDSEVEVDSAMIVAMARCLWSNNFLQVYSDLVTSKSDPTLHADTKIFNKDN